MRPTLIIMCGLSASGKSTKAKELAIKYDAIIVSTDNIRAEFGEVQDQSNNEEVFKIFHNRIKDKLLLGYNVIADATNITIKSRRQIFELVKNIDCRIVGIVMTKPVEQCIEDNIYREFSVPHHVIQKQMMNYQIPFYEEGFDEIRIITNKSDCDDLFILRCKHEMNHFDQNNPHHNENLFNHCDTVTKKIAEKSNNIELLMSAQIHDYSKIHTRKDDENGISHYYNHENVGAYYFLSNFNNMANYYLTKDEILDILFYINYHMLPMNWNSDKAKDKWRKIFGDEKFDNLVLFHECDKYRSII